MSVNLPLAPRYSTTASATLGGNPSTADDRGGCGIHAHDAVIARQVFVTSVKSPWLPGAPRCAIAVTGRSTRAELRVSW